MHYIFRIYGYQSSPGVPAEEVDIDQFPACACYKSPPEDP